MNDLGFPILTIITVLPLIGAVAVAAVPRDDEQITRGVTFLVSVATGILTLYLLAVFDREEAGFQFVTEHSWVSTFGIP